MLGEGMQRKREEVYFAPFLQKFLRAPMLLVAKQKDGFCCCSRLRLQLAMYSPI